MKSTYMVEFVLHDAFSKKFKALLPRQRYVISQMMMEGLVQNYSIASDRAKLWVVISAESHIEVLEEISRMPLIDFMEPHISILEFHAITEEILEFSLN